MDTAPRTPDTENPWETLSTRRYYESSYLDLEEDTVRHRSGREHPYTAVRFRVYGVAVIPILKDGCTCLVGQYRYLSKRYTWELPRGAGRIDLPAVESGRRELEEEAGLRGGDWLELFTLMASPGITTELAPCFVAWNLEETAPELAPEEELALRRIPFRDAVAAALDGTICDAASIATILALQARALKRDLPEELLRLLEEQV